MKCSMDRAVVAFVCSLVWANLAQSATQIYYVDNQIGSDSNDGILPFVQFGHGPLETIQEAIDKSLSVSSSTEIVIQVKGSSVHYTPFKMKRSDTTVVGYATEYANATRPSDLDDNMHQNVPVVPTEYGDYYGAREVAANPHPFVPLIDGENRNDDTSMGVDLNGKDNITIRNLYVTGVYIGVGTGIDEEPLGLASDHCTIENVFCFNVGKNEANTNEGSGIWIYSGNNANPCESPVITNCVVLNGSYSGIEMTRTLSGTITKCRVYADDNSTLLPGATDYYFLVGGGSSNTFSDCDAERYPDKTTGVPLAHTGHGFTISALETWGMTATNNTFSKCHARNMADVCLLRGANAHSNTYQNCTSVVEAGAEQESDGSGKPLGCIKLTNGPHDNTFRRIKLENSDVAVSMGTSKQGTPDWGERDYLADHQKNVAEGNIFENCIFECETGIRFSDLYDEIGTYQNDPTPGGNMTDGSDVDIVNNHFIHCTFIGSDELGVENAFFFAGREASGNRIVNCIITDFDHYAKYFAAWTNFSKPAALAKVRFTFSGEYVVTGFAIENSCIYNPNSAGNEIFPTIYDEVTALNNSYDVDPDLDANFLPGFQNPILDIADPDPLPPHTFPLDFLEISRGPLPDIGALERVN